MQQSIWPELKQWLHNTVERQNDHDSLTDAINKGDFISRIGCMELHLCANPNNKIVACRHLGISPPNLEQTSLFKHLYIDGVQNSDMIGEWRGRWFHSEPSFLRKHAQNTPKIHAETIGDAAYFISNDTYQKSWFYKALTGKKVLIIHSFSETMKQQYEKKVFHYPIVESIHFYKAPNTQSELNETIEISWKQYYEKCTLDFKTIDFDVALIGCGGYSIPFGNYIKKELKKSAVVVGGALQLYFAIRGNRWDTHGDYEHLQKLFDDTIWVRPNDSEKPNNWKQIENGAYW